LNSCWRVFSSATPAVWRATSVWAASMSAVIAVEVARLAHQLLLLELHDLQLAA
jgi:hypothetical protein